MSRHEESDVLTCTEIWSMEKVNSALWLANHSNGVDSHAKGVRCSAKACSHQIRISSPELRTRTRISNSSTQFRTNSNSSPVWIGLDVQKTASVGVNFPWRRFRSDLWTGKCELPWRFHSDVNRWVNRLNTQEKQTRENKARPYPCYIRCFLGSYILHSILTHTVNLPTLFCFPTWQFTNKAIIAHITVLLVVIWSHFAQKAEPFETKSSISVLLCQRSARNSPNCLGVFAFRISLNRFVARSWSFSLSWHRLLCPGYMIPGYMTPPWLSCQDSC